MLYVIVNGDDVFQISGVSDKNEWLSCYPCVAEEDGTYEIALCYLKDSDASEGDDTVYIDNMRVVSVDDIDVETFLPREAAVAKDDAFEYAEIFYNEKDGYYHVGSENGPLLLANLMNYSQFNEEQSVYEIVYNGDADKDGISLYDKENGGKGMVKYFSYASNSSLGGVCTVNKELGEMLKQVAEVAGFDGDENEWLKMCVYYEVFGPKNTQLQDPIKGLSPSRVVCESSVSLLPYIQQVSKHTSCTVLQTTSRLRPHLTTFTAPLWWHVTFGLGFYSG